jgi:hypothetical protein
MLRRDGVGVFGGGIMIDMNSQASYWTGYVIGQINKNMEVEQIMQILYKAFEAAIIESKKDVTS